jgi:hypothetical protein
MSDQVSARRPGLRAEPRPSYRPVKQSGVDPEMRRIGMIAGGCVGVAVAVACFAMLVGHGPHGVPVIEPEAGPVRVKPADPGGMKVTGSELTTGAADGNGQALAPAAEQPQIAALRAQVYEMKRQMARQAAQTAQVAKLAAEAAQQKAAQRVVQSPPAERAAATARIPPILMPQVPPTARIAPEPPAAAESGVRVQLAAFSDAAAAHEEWTGLASKMPDLFSKRRPEITSVEAAGRTMWRLRTGPFAGVTEANAFCATLRTRGADCSVAAF